MMIDKGYSVKHESSNPPGLKKINPTGCCSWFPAWVKGSGRRPEEGPGRLLHDQDRAWAMEPFQGIFKRMHPGMI